MRRAVRDSSNGFVLLAVLWILVGVAAVGLMVTTTAREALAAARNRTDLVKASWLAEGCLERTRSAIDRALADSSATLHPGYVWSRLDRVLAERGVNIQRCDVSIVPSGVTINVNSAPARTLHAAFVASGIDPSRADSLADALLDWRDPDESPRPAGAEKEWYIAERRMRPRNGPIANVRELTWIRGYGELTGLDTIFGVDSGRIWIERAPLVVLATLPGVTNEFLAHVLRVRAEQRPVELAEILGRLSPHARNAIDLRFQDFSALTTSAPDAWIARSRSRVGSPPISSVIEVTLLQGASRAAVIRRRTWIE